MDWNQMWAFGFVLWLLSVQTERDKKAMLLVFDCANNWVE